MSPGCMLRHALFCASFVGFLFHIMIKIDHNEVLQGGSYDSISYTLYIYIYICYIYISDISWYICRTPQSLSQSNATCYLPGRATAVKAKLEPSLRRGRFVQPLAHLALKRLSRHDCIKGQSHASEASQYLCLLIQRSLQGLFMMMTIEHSNSSFGESFSWVE